MLTGNATDGRLATTLPWTISAMTVALLPHVFHIPAWIPLLFVSCAALRWRTELRRGRLLHAWVRSVAALACFLGVLGSFGGINGVGPGSALLCVMGSLKLLETRRMRDQFVLLFIALFLMLATFLRAQLLWSIPYLLGGMALIAMAWLNVARRGAPLSIATSARMSAKLLLQALPVLLALWILFPRVQGAFWVKPERGGQASTGISNTMSPGDITRLSRSNEVAFRIRFEDTPPPQRELYWRGLAMYRFNGRSWTGDEPNYVQDAAASIEVAGEPIRYTITLEPTYQRWLFALDMPHRWDATDTYMGTQQQLQRTEPVNELFSYEVESHTNYRIARELSERARDAYTSLPAGSNPRAAEFARQLRAEVADDQAFIERVLTYFRREAFFYTLNPPPLGAQPVDEFLFASRRGFCEHYASAFGFVMRAAGIPARIVAGYQGGELNPLGGYMIVRQSDAHAWTEVWLEDRGWVRVDPTAAVAPARIEENLESALRANGESLGATAFDMKLIESMQLALDFMNARWDEWILGYGPETQRDFLRWLGLDDPDWTSMTLVLVTAIVASMALLSLWLIWRHRRPSPDPAQRQYREFCRRLDLAPRQGEAPAAFAARAALRRPDARNQIDYVTALYLRARYADDKRAQSRLAQAVRSVPSRRSASGT
jgi:transglutaminase-like putative cysteine protease